MPIPKEKSELLEAIDKEYQKLSIEIDSFPMKKANELSFEGHKKGTQMSFHNLISYLLGWGELVLKWNSKISNKEEMDWPERGYKWTELGELAQKFYQDYSALNIQDVIANLNQNHFQIKTLVEKQSNKNLYSKPWYKNYPMGRMIQLNTSSPYKNARLRIRKWKKEKMF